jgi:hypothetical protein
MVPVLDPEPDLHKLEFKNSQNAAYGIAKAGLWAHFVVVEKLCKIRGRYCLDPEPEPES